MFMHQNATASGRSRHTRPRVSSRAMTSTRPSDEQAVDAEERRVRVHRRRVEPLHVVERDRRVDQEPEDAGAHQVPERDADEEADRPAVARHPRRRRLHAAGLVRLEADQHQRDHLQRAERGADRHDRGRRAAEVQVVEGARDAGEQEQGARRDHRAARVRALHEAEPREDHGDRRRREHLEEALDPEVHDPPPPVLHHGEVRLRGDEESAAIHQADRDRWRT